MKEMTKLICTLSLTGKVCEVREVSVDANPWKIFSEVCDVEDREKSYFTSKEINQFIRKYPQWIGEEKTFFLYKDCSPDGKKCNFLVKIVWMEKEEVRLDTIRFLDYDVWSIFSYIGEERARVVAVVK